MKNQEIETTLSNIRNLMERSTRFLSLSGNAVILIGIYAILGAVIGYLLFGDLNASPLNAPLIRINNPSRLSGIITLALFILAISSVTMFIMSWRKAKKTYGQVHLDQTTRRLFWSFSLPLAAGGILCFSLLYQHYYGLTSSIMLIFYGLSLVNCSKYTHSDIQYLGYAEILLGLVDSFIQGYALYFWVVGFGLFHLLYGTYFRLKHESRKTLPEQTIGHSI